MPPSNSTLISKASISNDGARSNVVHGHGIGGCLGSLHPQLRRPAMRPAEGTEPSAGAAGLAGARQPRRSGGRGPAAPRAGRARGAPRPAHAPPSRLLPHRGGLVGGDRPPRPQDPRPRLRRPPAHGRRRDHLLRLPGHRAHAVRALLAHGAQALRHRALLGAPRRLFERVRAQEMSALAIGLFRCAGRTVRNRPNYLD